MPDTPQTDESAPPEKFRLRCKYCGVKLLLSAKMRGKELSCPKCKHPLKAPPPKKDAGEPADPEPEAQKMSGRNAYTAWKDFEESRKDSYWVAVAKACLYPYKALGALIFFVVGVPITVALVEAVAKAVLIWGGASEMFGQADKLKFFSAGVVFFSLFAVLALMGFFCSFLFAVVRTSSEGRTATPVIEGMSHRSNLAALAAWAALYFGPGLYLGHYLAEPGALFAWSPVAVCVLGTLILLAPMGLLCSATVSAAAGLNPVQVSKGIAAAPREYAYLLLVNVASAALFVAIGLYIGDVAAAKLETSWAVGVGLRILSGLFFMFPPVVLARSLGLLLQYRQDHMPFTFDFHSEQKGSAIPQVVALIGCIALFQPLWVQARAYARQGGKVNEAAEHLADIHKRYLLDPDGKPREADDSKTFEALVPEEDRVPPGYEGARDNLYAIAPRPQASEKEIRDFIWIYEAEPVGTAGTNVNVLLRSGEIKTFPRAKVKELLELMRRWGEAEGTNRKRLMDAYKQKLVLF